MLNGSGSGAYDLVLAGANGSWQSEKQSVAAACDVTLASARQDASTTGAAAAPVSPPDIDTAACAAAVDDLRTTLADLNSRLAIGLSWDADYAEKVGDARAAYDRTTPDELAAAGTDCASKVGVRLEAALNLYVRAYRSLEQVHRGDGLLDGGQGPHEVAAETLGGGFRQASCCRAGTRRLTARSRTRAERGAPQSAEGRPRRRRCRGAGTVNALADAAPGFVRRLRPTPPMRRRSAVLPVRRPAGTPIPGRAGYLSDCDGCGRAVSFHLTVLN